MVDSRQKGARAEAAIAKILAKDTGLPWKRTPGSGAFHEDHGLKGDIYVPKENNIFCVEVKHYKDCQFNTKVLTDKSPIFLDWWEQAVRQGVQTDKSPLLFFKHDRSKWFVAGESWQMFNWKDSKRAFLLWPEDIVILEYSEFKQHCMDAMEWI